jgi:hypothetical protein
MKSVITPLLKYQIAETLKNEMFSTSANTYIGIGRPIRWGNDNTEVAGEIEEVSYTTNYINQVYRDMVAVKKITASDIALVVPRVDWTTSTRYDEYLDHREIFSHDSYTSLGNLTASASSGCTAINIASSYNTSVEVGSIITIGSREDKEVVTVQTIATNTILTLNSATSTAYTNANTLAVLQNTYPKFANNFYVLNSKDQVFKCLFNNSNGLSTVEPTIDIDGQLPENPYVEPGDGYKWKYLYTIPYGYKQKFFTKNWMPVLSDNAVTAGALDGRIDIIKVVNGGTGYYLSGQSGNSNTLPIITVVGDGTGANVTAKVASGVIVDLNILNGGFGYTKGTIVVNDPDQLANGTPASFDVNISPKGGHGSNPLKELGCYTAMVSVDLIGTESGQIPVGSPTTGQFDFRQISLIRDPQLANGRYATSSVYRTTTVLTVSDPGITNFTNDEVVSTTAGFTATVIDWDPNNNLLSINNKDGTLSVGDQVFGNVTGAVSTVTAIQEPTLSLFTGDLLYIENKLKVIRDIDQSEQIRVILSF